MNISIGKFIGCTMMVIGSAIGAGILFLPLDAAGPGFILSAVAILSAWALLTISGLLVAEMSLALPHDNCSFSSMAEKTLGVFGKTITWLATLFLLYATLWAYMAGESTLIAGLSESLFDIRISKWLASGLFTLVLGAAVFWSTQAVDDLNRGLFSFKGLLLVSIIALMLPKINLSMLISEHSLNMGNSKYLWAAAPILLCIFNYHFIIPSLRMYIGDKPKELKWIIIAGTTISLIIYLLWATVALGIIPLDGENSFLALTRLGYAPGGSDLAKTIIAVVQNKWVAICVNSFFNIAMTTSFLGVALGLFDFLADGFKLPNTRFGRLQTSILTFVPPFILAMIWPHGSHMAMRWTACPIAILCLILPAVMVYNLRKHKELNSPYRVFGGNFLFTVLIVLGLILFVLPILTNLDLLPVIK